MILGDECKVATNCYKDKIGRDLATMQVIYQLGFSMGTNNRQAAAQHFGCTLG